MNVLSLFDGLSCGQLALQKAGIKYDNYFASEIDKDAIKVTQHNFPKTIQLGDVTKVKASDLPQIDLLIGGSPCFVAGTKVLTEFGYKNIENIVIGDKVLSHTGNWQKVLNVGKRDNISTRLIKGYGNIGIETTDEHPFYIKTMSRIWKNDERTSIRISSKAEWLSAKDLNRNHYCSTVSITDKSSITHDKNFWYMIGRYTGDGRYRKTKRKYRKNSYIYQFIICCGKHEFDELKSWFDKFGHKYNFSEERTGFKFRVCSQKLVEFVEPIGKKAPNKKVHPMLFLESIENKKAFIDGLWDSDGCVSKQYGDYRLGTTSYELALGVQQLIADVFHRPSSFEFTKRKPTCIIEGRIVNQNNSYEIRYKKDTRKQNKAFNDGIYNWMPIKYNELTNQLKTVYNIEVEIDNSYTANNVVVHNCQGFSFAGKQLNFDDERSKLFFEYLRLKNELKPKGFLLENVRMKWEYQDVISEYMGVRPIEINSNKFVPQNRPRLYWTNIPIDIFTIPVTRLRLRDILLPDGDSRLDKFKLSKEAIAYMDRLRNGKPRWEYHTNPLNGHAACLTANMYKGIPYGVIKEKMRRLHPIECERLQGVTPDDYTSVVSNTQRFKMLGNGWTVDTIAYIFKNIK